ncbi:MAG: hypothetical protein ACP5TV_02660 [Anaerolineae bacterium]
MSFTGAFASGLWIAGGGGGEEAAFLSGLYVMHGEMSTIPGGRGVQSSAPIDGRRR